MIKICGISGSLRKASFNTALLKEAQAIAGDHGAEIAIASIREIPFYDGDVEDEHGIPASVTALADAIRAADAVMIATPEYNAAVPGVLKNALDWASRAKPQPFDGKAMSMIGTSPGKLGTVRAQMQLRNSMANLNARMLAQPMVFVGGAGDIWGEGGSGLDDSTRGFLGKHIAALVALAKQQDTA